MLILLWKPQSLHAMQRFYDVQLSNQLLLGNGNALVARSSCWSCGYKCLQTMSVRVSALQDILQKRSQMSSNSTDSEQLALHGKDSKNSTASRSVTMHRCARLRTFRVCSESWTSKCIPSCVR